MNVKKILSLLLALLLVGSMAACGNKPAENQNNNDGEPQTCLLYTSDAADD